jgi:lysyl-tRNA synthetase class 2
VSRSLTVRQLAALGVAAAGFEGVLSVAAPDDPSRRRLIRHIAPAGVPTLAHLLVVLVGLTLLALAPRLWRGTRTAASLAIVALAGLAVLNLIRGLDYEEATLELGLAALLVAGRRAFPLGSRNRPRPLLVCAGVGAWTLAYCAVLVGPLASDRHHAIRRALHHAISQVVRVSLGETRLSGLWVSLIEALLGCAVAISVLAVRSLLRPAAGGAGHRAEEYWAARAIAERHGEDSLSPFILRPDKAFHFAQEGVLAYRVIGETAVVSGDPIAPDGAAPGVLASFLALARKRGWQVAVWGASARHLDAYRALGMCAVRAGEEAIADPKAFTLVGRPVRKLRQSVHRIECRGWQVMVCDGRDLDATLEDEIDALEAAWRAGRRRLLGFSMGMGAFEADVQPNDLILLARSPEGELRAVMRFIAHCGKLSLDTMRRVGETPNGLNEALVCRALEVARDRGVPEVSLNYAGLAHLVRGEVGGTRTARCLNRAVLRLLGRHFQLERLVRFNEKFLPEWRPRFLIYESRAALPRVTVRVLQAEGYLPHLTPPRVPDRWRLLPRALPGSAHANAAS